MTADYPAPRTSDAWNWGNVDMTPTNDNTLSAPTPSAEADPTQEGGDASAGRQAGADGDDGRTDVVDAEANMQTED